MSFCDMLGLLNTIVIQQYQYIIQLEPQNPNFWPEKRPKMKVFGDNGPEMPPN